MYVKGAPDQLFARAKDGDDGTGGKVPVAQFKDRFFEENERLGKQGLRVLSTGTRDFDPAIVRRQRGGPPAARQRHHPPGPGRHRRPAAIRGQGRDRDRPPGRHPGPDDHRRPRGDRRGDRPPARHHGAGRSPAAEFAAMDDETVAREIDGIGVIARVAPEDKVHLVDILQAQGPRRRDDRRRRERRAGAQEGRHRRRDGHHRHGGLEGGRGDDPDRRQLRDDRQGGRARPRALRQPDALHPLPDGRPVRVHRDVPRGEPPEHRRRPAVHAAPDAVGELHRPGVPGDRARLRRGPRGPDEGHAATARAADPAAAADGLGDRRRPRDRRRHARRHLVGHDRLRRRPWPGRWA